MAMPMQPQVPVAPQVMAPPMVPPKSSLRGHVAKKLAGKKAKK